MANSTAFTSGRDLPSVAENVELLTGQRGNKLDKAVTYRDLESLGVATLSRIGSSYSAKANPVLTTTASVVDTPTKPKNVQANGAFNTILIEWDEPDYRGHQYAEVFRAETDNLSIAVKIGTTSARLYSDPIGGDAHVYYWVRFVNANNVTGPFNSSAGTFAETAVDVQQLLDALTGQIEESNLTTELLSRINKIEVIDANGQVNTTTIAQINIDLSSLADRQAQAEDVLKAAQGLLGKTTIDVSLLHDELSQQVLKYGTDVQNLRDAILTVDPATGEITIDAINVVRTELQTNIDQVTQRVSSVEGTLTQKASSVEVNLQAQRISTVETQMNSINAELTNQVTRAEFTDTQDDVTQLTTRMSAAEGSISTKAEQQTVTDLDTRVSSTETELIAVNDDLTSKAQQINNLQSSYQSAASDIAENSASITELSQTVTDNESAATVRLDNLDSSVSGMNSAITSLQQTVANSNESTAYNYSQLKAQTDLTALAAANTALADDESSRKTRTSEASIRSDLTVLTNEHESLAQSVEVLQADFASETAAISAQIANEQTARTTAVDSLAQVVSTIDANYKSADITTNARIATEETARASADSALSTRVDQLLAATNSNTALIQTEQTARTTAIESVAQQISNVQAVANSKNKIYLQADAPTAGLTIGDIWYDSDDNNKSYRWDGTTWAAASDVRISQNVAAIQSEATARSNADSALSSRIDTIQATANNLTASVQTQSQAISTLENGAQAMWTAKTQVGQITSGIGVMTDSNGKSQVMISASQLFVFDPNSAAPTQSLFAVSDGKVVIQKAVIEKATIETVTAMSITADYVRAGVSITSPAINGGTLAIGSGDNSIFLADGAIGLGKGGPYGGLGWGWHTIIYADGGLYTDRLHASSGDFTGYVHATSGYFENVTIAENCNVLGTVYANKIVGDVVAAKLSNKNQTYSITTSTKRRFIYVTVNISGGAGTYPATIYARLYVDGNVVDIGTIRIPAREDAFGAIQLKGVISANAGHSYKVDWDGGDSQCVVLLFSETTGSIY